MSGIVEHALRALRVLEEITRPPRGCIGCGKSDCGEKCANAAYYRGAEQLSEREAEEEVHEPRCGVEISSASEADYDNFWAPDELPEPALTDDGKRLFIFANGTVHSDPLTDELRADGWEYTPIPEPPLTDDELIAIRGLIQERYEPESEPESVADYMARAERVESGYIIHELEDDDRLAGLAAATYSSATPPADDPAGVEHSPVPPAGIPISRTDLWEAADCVDLEAANADNYAHKSRLWSLATRLRDASRALRK